MVFRQTKPFVAEFFGKNHPTAGMDMEDLGQQTLFDENGGRYEGFRVHYGMKTGHTLGEFRSCSRIAQIDIADIMADTVNFEVLLIKAFHRMRGREGGQTVIYCNEDVYTSLDTRLQARAASGGLQFRMMEWAGMEVMGFRGTPIRMCDAILGTEGDVTNLTASDYS